MMDQNGFLNDPEINQLLDEFAEVAEAVAKARQDGDYLSVSFNLGQLTGLASRVMARNEILTRTLG